MNVVAGDANSDLSITNTGKAALGTVTVSASVKGTATFAIGDSGTATADDITVTGNDATHGATLTVSGTAPAKVGDNQPNNLTAASLTVNGFGTANLNAAYVLINGDVTVAKDGSLATDTDNKTTVAKTLTLAKGAELTNSGALTVGTLVNNTEIANSGSLTIKGVDGATSVNAGTILSDADKNVTVAGNFDNQLYVDSSSKKSAANLTADTLTVSKGTFNNAGIVEVSTLTLDEGAVYNTTYLTEAPTTKTATTTYTEAETIDVNEGAILNIADLNQASVKDGTNDQLAIVSDINLNGGVLQVKGASTETVDVVLSKKLTVGEKSEQTFKSVLSETNGDLTIDGGKVSVTGTLEISGGSVNLVSGDLDVSAAGAKIFTDDKQNFTIEDDGYLITTADALGLTIKNNALTTEKTKVTAGDTEVEKEFKGLTNKGGVSISGLSGSVKTIDGLQSKVSDLFFATPAAESALVELGDVTVEDLKQTDGAYDADDVTKLSGIVLNVLKNATISNVSNQKLNGQYGKLVLADGTNAFSTSAYTILSNNGNLVEDKDGKLQGVDITTGMSFAYRGADDATGAVKYVTMATDGKLYVEGGTLEVQGSIAQNADGTGIGGIVELDENTGLIVNGDINVTKLDIDGAVTVKNYTSDDGEVTPGITTVDKKFSVGTSGSFETVGTTKLNEGGTVYGKATFAELVLGNGKTLYVGNDKHNGHATIGKLTSGTVTFDPDFDPETKTIAIEKATTGAVKAAAAEAVINVFDASIVGIGAGASEAEAVAAFTATGWGLGERNYKQNDGSILNKDAELVKTVVAVNTLNAETQKHETFGGKLHVGSSTDTFTSDVEFAANTMLIVDATKVDTTGATKIFGKDIAFNSKAELVVTNFGNGDKIAVGTFADADSRDNFQGKLEDVAFTGDVLMEAGLVTDSTTTVSSITVGMIDKAEVVDVLGDLPGLDAAYAMFETRANTGASSSVAFNNWLYSSVNQTSYQGIRDAAKDVAGLGATTGVQTLTMDAVNQMADTVAARTSILAQRGQGVNVWADVNGGKFEAKTLFDGAGYSSDIYSGVLGLDYQFSCNAVLGAALTIGTADTDSKNSGVAASTDSDLVGFSVYASKTFADIWNVSADIGYLQASNDVTANGYAHAWKFSEDTDAWTVGVRGEVLTKAGSVNIVPHLGLRYTAISTDGFEAGYVTDIDDQNVFQMPVGVTVSADFETNGWTIAPKFDLSVVPTFGDKDADLKLGITGVSTTDDYAVRVIDSNPVQAQLGVNATNGAWGFGLSYKLGAGSDDRMNNSFNANVRYAF